MGRRKMAIRHKSKVEELIKLTIKIKINLKILIIDHVTSFGLKDVNENIF